MRKILIRKLGVASVARFVGVANAILAFVVGFISMFGGLAAVVDQKSWTFIEKIFGSLGVVLVSLVVAPIIGFVIGWLYGAVLALISNLFLHTANGIELDIEDEK